MRLRIFLPFSLNLHLHLPISLDSAILTFPTVNTTKVRRLILFLQTEIGSSLVEFHEAYLQPHSRPYKPPSMATVEHCLYCFETLAANLEKRSPMTLYQVQSSWADYPKGLEDGADAEQDEDTSESDEDDAEETATSATNTKDVKPRPAKAPSASNLLAPRSSTTSNTPSSSSSTSLATSTSTPASSTTSSSNRPFLPTGISPARTSQRATITESPLFVTWNTVSSGSHQLRGCIGTFDAQPLASGLSSYALTSALHDTRFSPISKSELPQLSVSVTLLTDFETCAEPMDWEVGVHGIRISFYHHHKRYGATYLPDVCVEQGWSKEECMVSLMRKAGWLGRREKWAEVGDLKVVRYQGMAESVDYQEYKTWRDWVVKGKGA